MNSKQRFLRACKNLALDHPPVWIMRQAGRALPEYLALRKKYSFEKICQTPELAALASLQPVRRFKMDACIMFSDILVVPAAMGLKVRFSPGVSLSPAVAARSDLKLLKAPAVEKALGYAAKTIKNIRAEVGEELAVLGFSGAPFTLAAYMVEGRRSKNFPRIKTMISKDPALFKDLLAKIANVVADYLQMQIEAKVTALQLFDTWAGQLAPEEYERFVLPGVQEIVSKLGCRVPIIYYINGISNLLELAAQTGANVLGIDWRISLSRVRKRLGPDQVVQGNLDPHVLLASAGVIRARVFEMLEQTRGRGHIVNLGHGLLPQTRLGSIETFVDSVKEWPERKK